ncbi:MAG: ABC transporter substrate-binding protein [Flavobacteriales bacterium]|nr:ABC transporter substrate-binding protein [Flavobacteriales bacterium]
MKRMPKMTFILFGMAAALGCSQPSPDKSEPVETGTLVKVRIGYLPIAAGLPLFVAMDKGYFKEAGFAVELTRFASSNDLGTAATTGQVDALMPFALNAGFDIGAASGKRHKLFGLNIYSDQAPHIVDYMVVRQGSGIKSLEDLRGRKVAGFPGSVTKVFVENILEQNGVKPGEYTYVALAPPEWLAALQSGAVDAASVMEPQASMITSQGVATVVIPGFFAKLMPDVPLSGHWLAAQFVESHDAAVSARFAAAFDRSVDYIRANPEDAKQSYIMHIGIEQSALTSIQLNKWVKSTELQTTKVKPFADLLWSKHAIQEEVNVTDYMLGVH